MHHKIFMKYTQVIRIFYTHLKQVFFNRKHNKSIIQTIFHFNSNTIKYRKIYAKHLF